jgi:hypothetical protein
MTGYISSLPSSSKTIVSGTPSPLSYAGMATLSLPQILTDAINKAINEETDEIRKSLESDGHADLAKDFSIKYNEKEQSFVFEVGGTSGQQAKTLEYGDLKTAPKGIFRKLIRRRASSFEKKVNSYIKEGLGL